jgi:hypothetical protein
MQSLADGTCAHRTAAQVGRLDDRFDPAAAGDDAGGGWVVPAMQVGAAERPARVSLVQSGGIAAARSRPAAGNPGGADATSVRVEGGLLFRLPAHVTLQPLLGRPRSTRAARRSARIDGARFG